MSCKENGEGGILNRRFCVPHLLIASYQSDKQMNAAAEVWTIEADERVRVALILEEYGGASSSSRKF